MISDLLTASAVIRTDVMFGLRDPDLGGVGKAELNWRSRVVTVLERN